MPKFLIAVTATFAFANVAIAADLPHPQPVAQDAPIGKMPIGKMPLGKMPLGKAPAPAPIITKG